MYGREALAEAEADKVWRIIECLMEDMDPDARAVLQARLSPPSRGVAPMLRENRIALALQQREVGNANAFAASGSSPLFKTSGSVAQSLASVWGQ